MRAIEAFPRFKRKGVDDAFRLTGSVRVLGRAVRLPRLGSLRTKDIRRGYGSRVVVAPRFFPSSKTCSDCGQALAALPLSIRTWACPGCGVEHDRDGNAARNLVVWYRRTTGSSPGSDACGESSGGAGALAPASHGSKKQESAAEQLSVG